MNNITIKFEGTPAYYRWTGKTADGRMAMITQVDNGGVPEATVWIENEKIAHGSPWSINFFDLLGYKHYTIVFPKEESSVLSEVIEDLKSREQRGVNKYGTTVDRTDLTQKEWLQHAYEEALDLCVYLKKFLKNS